jgi:glyoxylase-like metal-dependent hydrolase (beta-lactamase superfamily II)
VTTKIRHISCATMCPAAATVPGLMPRSLVAHVLVVETVDRLVLVDTGFGRDDVRERGKRLGRPFVAMVGAQFDPAQTAYAQLPGLGYAVDDVTDIVVTHLDLDHAGGLPDFPGARVHVHANELAAATHPSLRERARYVRAQWAHGPRWVEHTESGDDWLGFIGVSAICDDLALVPLHGHTRGHSGVAVRRPDTDGGDWFLHAGDAYFHHGDLAEPRRTPPGLKMFQAAMAVDPAARKANLARLRDLHATKSDQVTVFCAHDEVEFNRCR